MTDWMQPPESTVPEISVPDPDMIESRIAKDIARHALWVAPVAILALGLWQGVGGALGVALALVVVLANFLITGALLGWAARISPAMIMAVSLGGFLVWLIVIFGMGLLVEQIDAVNLDVFVVSVLVLHLGLLFWEMRSITFSLASPGLKPRKSWVHGVVPVPADLLPNVKERYQDDGIFRRHEWYEFNKTALMPL